MKTNWYLQLLKGIIMILLAILVFMSPGDALLGWAVYIGIGLIVAGIFIMILGFSTRGIEENWGWRIFEGIIDIFLGFVLLAHPALTAETLPFVVGFWGSFYGILLFVDAFSGTGNSGIKLISGILIFLASLTMMFNPLLGGMSLALWFAVVLLLGGLYNVIFSFSNR